MDESKSMSLKNFITEQRKILPCLVYVSKSSDRHIQNGDVLNIKTISQRYAVEYDNTAIKEQLHAFVPDDLGGLIVVSQFPANHIYPSLHDVSLDFPASVRVLDDLCVQNTLIQSGDELRLNKIHQIKGKNYMLCFHVKSTRDMLVPFDTKGRFQRIKDDHIYTVNELQHRMPVGIKRDPNIGEELKKRHELYLPGLPLDNPMFLMKSGAVHVDHWHQPSILDICTMNGVKELILRCEISLEVRRINYSDYLGPIQHHSLVSHGLISMVSGDDNDVTYDRRLPPKSSAVILDGSEVKQGVILRGTDSFLLVPKDYCKETLFRMRGKEYETPHDLWEANYSGVVIATQAAASPIGYPKLSSIYLGDNVTLKMKSSEHKKLKVVSNARNNEKRQAVKLIRSLTNAKGSLGKILVDSKAMVHFEEKGEDATTVIGSHRLSDIIRYGRTIPMDIALSTVPQVDGISDNDMILLSDSPFTITKICEYTVINVTTLHTNKEGQISRKQTFQIPTFVKYHLRISKESHGSKYNPVDLGAVEKPLQSFVWKLSPTEYKSIVGAQMSDSYRQKYETFIDSVFLPQSDLTRRLSRLYLDPNLSIVSSHQSCQSPLSGDFSSQSPPHRKPVPERGDDELTRRRNRSVPSREPPAVPISQKKTKSHSESSECKDLPPALPPKSMPRQPPPSPRRDQPLTPEPVQSEKHYVIETPPQLSVRGYANPSAPATPEAAQDVLPNSPGADGHSNPHRRTTSDSSSERPRTRPLPRPRRNISNPSQLPDDASSGISSGNSKGYLTPFIITDDSIPKVNPPADGNIASFTYVQMAGLLRHLDLNDHAIINCVNNKIDGQILMQIVRHGQSDDMICQELKLEKLSELYIVRQIVSRAESAVAIPSVKPPKDDDISNFSVQELAGLLKYLELSENVVSICLTKQIDGRKLCDMDQEVMCETLGIEENKSFSIALQYFVSKSKK